MTIDPQLRALRDVVASHLPSTRRSLRPKGTFGDWDVAEFFAGSLISDRNQPAQRLGVGEGIPELEEVSRSLRSALEGLYRLPPSVRSSFRWVEVAEDGAIDQIAFYPDFCEYIGKAHEISLAIKRHSQKQRAVSPKLDLAAVSVADRCREIWANEVWFAEDLRQDNFFDPASDEEFQEIIDKYSPQSQNHYRPGPFGRFVEDVFEILEIVGADGVPVKAATALKSLSKFDGKQS